MSARKLSPTARGYGHAHRALRERLKPYVEAGMMRCDRCGQLIPPGTPWDVAHVDGTERTVYSPRLVEHRKCNRATARHKKQQGLRVSRVW